MNLDSLASELVLLVIMLLSKAALGVQSQGREFFCLVLIVQVVPCWVLKDEQDSAQEGRYIQHKHFQPQVMPSDQWNK